MTTASSAAGLTRRAARRPVLAWALYDVASSTYIAIVPSLVFPVYFTAVIAADLPDARGAWGVVAALALIVSGIVAPFAGAHADLRRTRLALLAAFTLLCCVATAALPAAGRGQVMLGALLFVAAQVGYTVAMSLYDAYLGRLARHAGGPERLSSLGFALGMCGGIVAIALTLAVGSRADGVPAAEAASYVSAFPLVAALFLGLALPALAGLREVGEHEPPAPARVLARVASTLRGWRGEREVCRFLLGAYLVNTVVVTLTVFTAIYLREVFGVSLPDLLRLALLYHVVALPAIWLMGWLAHRTSLHAALGLALVVWIATLLIMAFGSGGGAAVTVVVLFATVFGSTQALLRALYARIVPLGRAGELFGFNSLVGRIAAALGPLVFASVAAASGSPRIALLALLAFLVAGAVVLWRVRPGETPVEL